jgi:hypothetical protein
MNYLPPIDPDFSFADRNTLEAAFKKFGDMCRIGEHIMYQVIWVDSIQPVGTWEFINEVVHHEPLQIASIGLCIYATSHAIGIAPNWSIVKGEKMQVSSVIIIPKVSIMQLIPFALND